MAKKLPKILVVLGPTSSGKTSLAVKLARKYNGEIVSADSRQVYRGMDVGTGKDLAEYGKGKNKVPYHLIDVVSPDESFDLAQYQKLAFRAIDDILKRKKLPILVGGSGLYLQAVVDNYRLNLNKPDVKRRKELESLSKDQLLSRLNKLKEGFAKSLNNSDRNNPRRLVRYLEILEQGEDKASIGPKLYNSLVLGLDLDDRVLRQRIKNRIVKRLEEENMLGEVDGLHDKGLSWQRLSSFGLEYRFLSYYLTEKIDYDEMLEKLEAATWRFARRQRVWFRRWQKQGQKVNWVNNIGEASVLVEKFI